MKRIAVLGEIGAGNLGDDFGYVLLRNEMQAAFDEMDVLVDIRPLTPNLFGLLESYHWDAVVTGCGTLLDEGDGHYVRALNAAAARCPVAILGSGFADRRHVPPTDAGRASVAKLAKSARHIWTRGVPAGMDPAMAAPDPAWLHGWHGTGIRTGIGINVGYAAFSTMRLDPAFLHTVDAARSACQIPTALVAAWRGDAVWLERLRRNAEPIHSITGTRASLGILQGFHAVMATRIHLAVMAACHGAFPIVPDYTTKVRDVFSCTDVHHRILPVDIDARGMLAALTETPPTVLNDAAVTAARDSVRKRVRTAAAAVAGAWS